MIVPILGAIAFVAFVAIILYVFGSASAEMGRCRELIRQIDRENEERDRERSKKAGR